MKGTAEMAAPVIETKVTETKPAEQATEDVTGLKSALQAERDAHKAEAKRAKDLEKRLADLENSGKSESDKLAARLEALEKDNQAKSASIQERDAKDSARDLAKKAGAPDVDLVYRVVKSDIEFEDGKPANLKDLIEDLKQTTPHLFKAATTRVDGGAGNGAKPAEGGMNAWIRDQSDAR